MDTVKLGMKQGLEHLNRAKRQDDFTNNSNTPAYNKYISIMWQFEDKIKRSVFRVLIECD